MLMLVLAVYAYRCEPAFGGRIISSANRGANRGKRGDVADLTQDLAHGRVQC
ncbi:protein of unknown function [Thauera humireducens]|nr:protein of unknown function [Thauera humireducens]